MAEPKERVASAIARAQADLGDALSELEKLSAFDPGSVAFVAHALNNFLVVTGGTVDVIGLYLGDNVDPQLRVWLEGLRHATDLMTHTVSQLVNATATVAAQPRLEKVDLPVMVQRACAYFQRVADLKSIGIVVEAANGILPVLTDRVVVLAVLDNLVSNAIKYSQPGTQIRVRVRGDTGWGVCEVVDEGPGLSPADRARLFQRGVRLTPTPTGGESSTGYGLAVAKELVDKVRGSIWCESVLGQGCCFGFRLPVFQEQETGPVSVSGVAK